MSAEFRVPAATVESWEAGTEQPPAQVTNSLEMIGRMSLLESSTGISPRQPEFKAIRDEGPLFKADQLIKSKKRVADHGEVFTPPWLVEKMLDLVKGETERIDSRFLEPACGSGNFLVPILQRKLAAVEAKYGKVDFEKRHYGIGLSPSEPNPEKAVADLVSFLPVLAYDGANMTQIDAGGILDIAMAGTSATLLARKWESAMLVNVDNDTLRRVLDNPEALAAVERIEGWRALGDNVIETIINKSEAVKDLKKKAKDGELSKAEKKELTDEEREYKNKRKQIQEKLIKFATRIPAFMYLTDFRENTLVDVITKIEPELFLTVTGLTVEDFNLLVRLRVFNTERMNEAVFAFRRYEDASLRYTGIESHEGLTHIGGYDTVVEVAQP